MKASFGDNRLKAAYSAALLRHCANDEGSSPFADPVQPFNLGRFYMVGTMETHAAGAERLPAAFTVLRMRFAYVHSTVGALGCRAVATILAPIIA